jgi:hypothetical protein
MTALKNTTFSLAIALMMLLLAACGTEEAPLPDAGSDALSDADTADTSATDSGTRDTTAGGCTEPDPSVTCQTTGCPSGTSCVLDPNGCAPSTCSCDESEDSWLCTADCGPAYVCETDVAPTCPERAPEPGAACDDAVNTDECTWGEECCCGACFPSFACACESGSWACYATDACFIESCVGRPCDEDADCTEGGVRPSVCEAGVCVEATEGCAGLDDAEACDGRSGCEWVVPSGCPELGGPEGIAEAGCYPDTRCVTDGECPTGAVCTEVSVAPRCAWEEPLCDACDEQRTLCVPDAR